jgi:TRAP-type C4-dicarboxylate transport system permease small subunit
VSPDIRRTLIPGLPKRIFNTMADASKSKKKRYLSTYLSYIGNIALVAMMFLTTADVVGRYFFNAPVLGAYEMTEYLMLIMVFSFLAFAQAEKSHICVDIVFNRLPSKLRGILERFNHIACLVMMAMVTWMGGGHVMDIKASGEESLLLKLPDYPFAIFLTIGCIFFSIEFLRDVFSSKKTGNDREAP